MRSCAASVLLFMTDHQQQTCPQCGQDSFDFEDTPIGLVCSCGYVVDDSVLVNQRNYEAEGDVQAGVHVAAEDDGTRAGAIVLKDGSVTGTRAAGDHGRTLSANRDRLQQALSAINLPKHIQTAAIELLPQVLRLNAEAEPRKSTTTATVAAIIYLAAREKQHALTLGRAGWSLGVSGADVAREFRRISASLIDIGYLDDMPPASLEALVKYTAATAMPHFLHDQTEGNRLWQHPIVKRCRDVAELLQLIEATSSRKPELAAAAIVTLCLSEHFRDARPTTYAAQVCQLMKLDRKQVQEQVSYYQDQLAPLVKLLPFSSGQPASAGFEAIRNAGLLLKLRHLLSQAKEEERLQT